MDSPHWLMISFIGALIGFSLPYLSKLFVYCLRYFKKDYLEGEWFEFHFNFIDGEPKLRREIWKVKKGINEKLVVSSVSIPDRKLEYKGSLHRERDHIIAKFRSTRHGHTEEVFCRLNAPIPSNDSHVVGLWLAIDFNGKTTVGPQLLSRHDLDESKAIRIMKAKTKITSEHRLVRIMDTIQDKKMGKETLASQVIRLADEAL